MKKATVYKPPQARASAKNFNNRLAITNLYDHQWEKYRAKFLAINSHCYACDEKANVVDHVQAHKGDVQLFWKLDNHIPLCTRCHNTVTGLFDRRFRSTSMTEKIQYLQDSRAVKDITRKVKVIEWP